MQTWTVIRYLHIVGVLTLVGGQLTLALAVAPAARRAGVTGDVMRSVGKRFGALAGASLALAVGTGIALVGRYAAWEESLLQVKIMLLVLLATFVFLHVMSPHSRAISWAGVATSLLIVYLGVKLTYG